MTRILLGQLGANGDCFYATILARQLRHDYPDAEISWAISSQCLNVTHNNPHIDRVIEIPVPGWDHHELMWRAFEREALQQHKRREYDAVLLSQIWPANFQNYDGTVRPSILRAYGNPITVPIENIICLTDDEIERVEKFAAKHRLSERTNRILFECSSKSGQSFVTPDIAQSVADKLYQQLPESCVIFSTHLPMNLRDARSIYAGELSLREIAHLTHHIDLFVGAGSGGSVVVSSSAARTVPMIQLLSASTSVFASFAHDFEYFGLQGRAVLESTEEDPAEIARRIAAVMTAGIDSAIQQFGGRVPVRFEHYQMLLTTYLLPQHRYLDAAQSLLHTADRYGWTSDLVEFAKTRILPNLAIDPGWLFAHNRRKGEDFRAVLDAAGRGSDGPSRNYWRNPAIRLGDGSFVGAMP